MKRSLAFGFALTLLSTPAWAQGGGDYAPGKNKDAVIDVYSGTGSPTPGGTVNNLGGALSGGFYGNASNAGASPYAPENGHGVTPSISPGPQVVDGDGPGTGTSIGEFIQTCRTDGC